MARCPDAPLSTARERASRQASVQAAGSTPLRLRFGFVPARLPQRSSFKVYLPSVSARPSFESLFLTILTGAAFTAILQNARSQVTRSKICKVRKKGYPYQITKVETNTKLAISPAKLSSCRISAPSALKDKIGHPTHIINNFILLRLFFSRRVMFYGLFVFPV